MMTNLLLAVVILFGLYGTDFSQTIRARVFSVCDIGRRVVIIAGEFPKTQQGVFVLNGTISVKERDNDDIPDITTVVVRQDLAKKHSFVLKTLPILNAQHVTISYLWEIREGERLVREGSGRKTCTFWSTG